MQKKFQKSAVNKKIFGVCGGLSEYFGDDKIRNRIEEELIRYESI